LSSRKNLRGHRGIRSSGLRRSLVSYPRNHTGIRSCQCTASGSLGLERNEAPIFFLIAVPAALPHLSTTSQRSTKFSFCCDILPPSQLDTCDALSLQIHPNLQGGTDHRQAERRRQFNASCISQTLPRSRPQRQISHLLVTDYLNRPHGPQPRARGRRRPAPPSSSSRLCASRLNVHWPLVKQTNETPSPS
jgi:hypothetical protein